MAPSISDLPVLNDSNDSKDLKDPKFKDPKEYQKIFHWAETQKNGTIPSFNTRSNDPYKVRIWNS
jgi:hypothetical protein